MTDADKIEQLGTALENLLGTSWSFLGNPDRVGYDHCNHGLHDHPHSMDRIDRDGRSKDCVLCQARVALETAGITRFPTVTHPYWYEGEPTFRYFKRSYESGEATYYATTCCRLGRAEEWNERGWMTDTMNRNEYAHILKDVNVREVGAADVPEEVRTKLEGALVQVHTLIVTAGNCAMTV